VWHKGETRAALERGGGGMRGGGTMAVLRTVWVDWLRRLCVINGALRVRRRAGDTKIDPARD
jgi:hypothetical protein